MWMHVKAAPGMGLEEQHVLRWSNAPVAVLKKSGLPDRWSLSLLMRNKISAETTMIVIADLLQAKRAAERMARELGWEPFNVTTKSDQELRQDAAE